MLEPGIGQRVGLHNQRRGVVVQDHIHPREAAGGGVLLLPVECHTGAGFVGDLQKQRAGPARTEKSIWHFRASARG